MSAWSDFRRWKSIWPQEDRELLISKPTRSHRHPEGMRRLLLSEMIIMGQDFADAFLPHRIYRNAVNQAIALVGAGFVEGKASKESLAGLRVYRDGGLQIKIACQGRGSVA